MAQLIKHKVQASTLAEVLIAMIIIMVVFVIATQIYANIMRSSPAANKLKATQQIQKILQKAVKTDSIPTESLVIDGITYKLEIIPSPVFENLSVLQVRAEQNGILLEKNKTLIQSKSAHAEN